MTRQMYLEVISYIHHHGWEKKTLHQICFEVLGRKMDHPQAWVNQKKPFMKFVLKLQAQRWTDDDNLTTLCVRRGKKLILNVLDHYGQAFETSRIVLGIGKDMLILSAKTLQNITPQILFEKMFFEVGEYGGDPTLNSSS